MQQKIKRAEGPRNVNLSLITSFKLSWLEDSEETFESNCHLLPYHEQQTLHTGFFNSDLQTGKLRILCITVCIAFGLTGDVIRFYHTNCGRLVL